MKTNLDSYIEERNCPYVENMMCLDGEHICRNCNICKLYNKAKAEENKND